MKHVGTRGDVKSVVSQEQIAPFQREYRQETAPTDARQAGDIWLQTSTGIRYEWYVAASSSSWVAFDNAEDAGATPLVTSQDIEVTDPTKGLVLSSPNGARWRLTVNNSGAPVFTSL